MISQLNYCAWVCPYCWLVHIRNLQNKDHPKLTPYFCKRLKSWVFEIELIWLSCFGSPIITARFARYSNGRTEAISHWLASSIMSKSNIPGLKWDASFRRKGCHRPTWEKLRHILLQSIELLAQIRIFRQINISDQLHSGHIIDSSLHAS